MAVTLFGAAGYVNFQRRFKLFASIWYETGNMEKIDPQEDHERLQVFRPGKRVTFRGRTYIVQRRTTLASGEAAVVLQGEREQFVIGAKQFLAGVNGILFD